jgi:hypothetical protein
MAAGAERIKLLAEKRLGGRDWSALPVEMPQKVCLFGTDKPKAGFVSSSIHTERQQSDGIELK